MDSPDGVIDLMGYSSSEVPMSVELELAQSAQAHHQTQHATTDGAPEPMEVDNVPSGALLSANAALVGAPLDGLASGSSGKRTPAGHPSAGPSSLAHEVQAVPRDNTSQIGDDEADGASTSYGATPEPGALAGSRSAVLRDARASSSSASHSPHPNRALIHDGETDTAQRTHLPANVKLSAAFGAYAALDADSDEEAPRVAPRRKGKSKAISRANVLEEEEEWDDRLYCVCQMHYNGGKPMIGCDLCEEWFHMDCVDIDADRVELVDQFICPNCEKTSPERTTWKAECARPACPNPVVALSKYCGDYCGIQVAARRLELSGQDPEQFWEQLQGARRRETEVVPSRVRRTRVDEVASNGALDEGRVTQQAEDRRASQALVVNLESLVRKRTEMEAHLGMIDARLRYLRLAKRRWEALCVAAAASVAATGAEAAPAAKSKSKGKKTAAGPTTAPTALCGFDVRLVMEDEDWAEWVTSDEGQQALALQPELALDAEGRPIVQELERLSVQGLDANSGLCFDARRKCERHKEWQGLREADYALEKLVFGERMERLAGQEVRLRVQMEEHEIASRFRAEFSGRTDPNPIAVDEADDGASVKAQRALGLNKSGKRLTESPAVENGAGLGAGGGAEVPESLLAAGLSRGELARLKQQGAF